jgi:hypothetical protein
MPTTTEMLDQVNGYLRRYVLMTDDQAYTMAAYVLHTWIYQLSNVTPYMAVMSPVKQSGKTTLLDCVRDLSLNGQKVTAPTAPVLFRMAESGLCLIWDEIDQRRPNREIMDVLNTGYKKGGSVPRNVNMGGEMYVKHFSTYCCKAFGAIGQVLHPTLIDRCIKIQLEKARDLSTITEYDTEIATKEAEPIVADLFEWAEGYSRPTVRPARPAALDARQKELWLPLLEIGKDADGVRGEWFRRLTRAAKHLSAGTTTSDPTIDLLYDIRAAFGNHKWLWSFDLLNAMHNLEDPAYLGPVTASQITLALFLTSHFQIGPVQIGTGPKDARVNHRGYRVAQFARTFEVYLEPVEKGGAKYPATPATPATPRLIEQDAAEGFDLGRLLLGDLMGDPPKRSRTVRQHTGDAA